jgi:hypothetical protein
VISLNAPVIASETQQATAPKQQEIVIVGQEQKPGDWVCSFIGGEGSLERRNVIKATREIEHLIELCF